MINHSFRMSSATVVISDDVGGKMRDYTTHFGQVRDSGEPVVIAGTCVSACTMVLGLIPERPNLRHP